jgi:hypothetical protein
MPTPKGTLQLESPTASQEVIIILKLLYWYRVLFLFWMLNAGCWIPDMNRIQDYPDVV